MKIYTSYYYKALNREKQPNDIYVQVSRSLGFPIKNAKGQYLPEVIDANWGAEFGMYSDSLDQYRKDLNRDDLQRFYDLIKDNIDEDMNIFLLCFENLDSVYTKADVAKHPDSGIREGERKKCHRTILADELNRLYGLGIEEFDE